MTLNATKRYEIRKQIVELDHFDRIKLSFKHYFETWNEWFRENERIELILTTPQNSEKSFTSLIAIFL